MNFYNQLHTIKIMQKTLYVSQFTNMCGKLYTSGIDTGHLKVPEFNQRKNKIF